MSSTSTIIGHRCITHRASGIRITDPSPIYREDMPYSAVTPKQPLLRYMDYAKFEDLFKTHELYFCRADKFKDPLEGTLSREGVHGTSASDIAFNKTAPQEHGSYDAQAAYRKIAKGCTFVNCWHINTFHTQKMWDAYTTSSDSVLIVSTAERLQASLKQTVIMSPVKYVSPDTPRADFGENSLFFYKDSAFSFEQEFRLLTDLMMLGGSVTPDNPSDFFRRVPVDLSTLVQFIQPHPKANDETKRKIAELVKRHLPNAKGRDESE